MKQKMTDILHIINEYGSNLSQREIAKKAGFSLGNVNYLLKKCTKKGLLKVKKLSPRKVKYLLTPNGMKVVTKKTLNFVQKSYQIITNLKRLMIKLTEEEFPEKEICILKDENKDFQGVWELIRNNLNTLNKNYRVYNTIEEIQRNESNGDTVIFYWNPELDDDLDEIGIDSVNIVKCLKIGRN